VDVTVFSWMAGSSPAMTVQKPRQSPFPTRPTASAIRVGNLLYKIRIYSYAFPLTESLSHSSKDGREDGRLWLFEMLVCNLPREPGRGSGFLTYIALNPLKRLDSQK
jgi:hypothetical protein